jgi:hypothetical protein
VRIVRSRGPGGVRGVGMGAGVGGRLTSGMNMGMDEGRRGMSLSLLAGKSLSRGVLACLHLLVGSQNLCIQQPVSRLE